MATTGHQGQITTILSVGREFWWPGMTTFVRNYVKGCIVCQATRNQPRKPSIPTQPIAAEFTLPFQAVTMDFITDLPESDGYDSIAVFVDHNSTKAAIMVPCHKTITAEQTTDIYLKCVFRRFGLPQVNISDRGPQFNANFICELCKKLGIKQRFSTAYHPQTDGETKRVNQELEQYLRAFCNFRQNNWAKYLIFAEFAHNSAQHSSTGQTPFYLLMGYHPHWFPSLGHESSAPAVEQRLEELDKACADAEASHAIAAELMRSYGQGKLPSFQKGQRV